MLQLAEHTEARFEMVEKIQDISKDKDGIFLHVQWAGLPDKSDWTWVAVEDMHQDVPIMLFEFLDSTKKKKMAKEAKKLLRLI